MRKHILSYSLSELQEVLAKWGEKPFRAKQIYEWLHVKLVDSFDEMTNISQALREQLQLEYTISTMEEVTRQVSREDGTTKYLFQLEDQNCIESVWMPYRHGNSICVSSQVGCAMGCAFCASSIGGLVRNLTTAEILSQVYMVQKSSGERISNVVIMGMGEPLDNYEEVIRFIRMLSSAQGLQISQRSITLSTCGVVPGIYNLAKEKMQITLALSLHQSNQEKRAAIMPIAKKYPIPEVMEACENYFLQTGRRMTYEYCLIEGVNDGPEDIEGLRKLLQGKNCHVNLILVNPVVERKFSRPNKKNAEFFQNNLEKVGIRVTIRREMGTDIDGACGQLRKRYPISQGAKI